MTELNSANVLEFVAFGLLRAVHLLHGANPGAEQGKFELALHDLTFVEGPVGDVANRAVSMRVHDPDCDLSSMAHEFIGAVCAALPALAASTSVSTAEAVLRYMREVTA